MRQAGIFSLVSSTLATTGFSALWGYAQILLVLVGCMAVVALVINPLLVWLPIRAAPLVFACVKAA